MTIQFEDRKTAEHLTHLIVSRNGNVPNFSLLLGAGASITSGVKTAQEMIGEWRGMMFQRLGRGRVRGEWLKDQPWYEHDDEYSILFETIYDQPSQRRVRVEEAVKGAHPYWGYIYLTNLMSSRFFDVVFTTNFDDLINEACYLYSDAERPIVAAHDSAIQGIRVTFGRPKIIKLHGDFLYDNIKNTLAELETLEANTKRKLYQFAQEYGLVVMGYSGRDRSVMDTLELLLRDDENYKQGVYWCISKGSNISSRLESLLRRDRVYLVEIDGFDEFMAELHKEARLTLPRAIAQPFEIAKERARLFIDRENSASSHSIINSHIAEVLVSVQAQDPIIPSSMKAAALTAMGRSSEAVVEWERAYKADPEDFLVTHSYADALIDAGEAKELSALVANAPELQVHRSYLLLRAGLNEEVIDFVVQELGRTSDPDDDLSEPKQILIINRAIALKRLGRTDEMRTDLELLEEAGYTDEINMKAGVAALKGDRAEMLATLDKCVPEMIAPSQLREFPVFEDYQDDPDFIQLVNRFN